MYVYAHTTCSVDGAMEANAAQSGSSKPVAEESWFVGTLVAGALAVVVVVVVAVLVYRRVAASKGGAEFKEESTSSDNAMGAGTGTGTADIELQEAPQRQIVNKLAAFSSSDLEEQSAESARK